MKSTNVLETLEAAASSQWGIITTAQAESEGITRLQLGRLAEQDIVTRVRRGIYLLPSAPYGPHTDIHLAWISLGSGQFPDERWESADKTVVSHASAAFIHNIGDLIPHRNEFSTTGRKQTAQDDIRIYNNRELDPNEIQNIRGLPVTTVERTVSDLAEQKIEFGYLATLVADSLQKEGVRFKVLAEMLNSAAPEYGFANGQRLVQACRDAAESDEDREEILDRYISELTNSTRTSPTSKGEAISPEMDALTSANILSLIVMSLEHPSGFDAKSRTARIWEQRINDEINKQVTKLITDKLSDFSISNLANWQLARLEKNSAVTSGQSRNR